MIEIKEDVRPSRPGHFRKQGARTSPIKHVQVSKCIAGQTPDALAVPQWTVRVNQECFDQANLIIPVPLVIPFPDDASEIKFRVLRVAAPIQETMLFDPFAEWLIDGFADVEQRTGTIHVMMAINLVNALIFPVVEFLDFCPIERPFPIKVNQMGTYVGKRGRLAPISADCGVHFLCLL
jgi:hypothetical protein